MLRLPSIDKGSKCREGVRYGASAENFAEKKRRGPPSRAAVLRWVLAAIACSGVLAYFPSVQRGVSGAAGAAYCRSGRWRSGWRSSRRACGASGRRRLRRCSCSPPASPRARRRSPPRRSALSKRAFRRRQRRLPRTNRRRSSRQSPIYPTPNRNPRHPLTSIRSRKHRPPLNRKFPPLPRPIPRRRSRPRPRAVGDGLHYPDGQEIPPSGLPPPAKEPDSHLTRRREGKGLHRLQVLRRIKRHKRPVGRKISRPTGLWPYWNKISSMTGRSTAQPIRSV